MLLSRKQREFVNEASHRWNFKGGATRSGKTYLDFKWMIPLRIRERAGKDGLCVIMGVTKSTIERNVLEPMRKIYGDQLVGSISSDNTAWLFGEKCYCLGGEKISQVSKIRGSSIKYCYGDEVADWSEEVFVLLKSRLDKEYSCFDGTFNPQYPGHWLKTFLDSDADIFSQTYTIDDNPFLPDSVKAEMKKEYAGTVFYDRYILGLWVAADGLVYPMFDPAAHVVDEIPWQFRQRGKNYISIDYGTTNPCSMGLWCVHNGEAIRVKEYYYDSRRMRRQKSDDEYYNDLEEFANGYQIERIVIDPSAASFKTEIRNHGRFAVWDADNDVVNGVRLTGRLINAGRLKFHRSCKDLIREFGAYFWDKDKTEDTVIKENDHCMTGDTLVDTLCGPVRIDELVGKCGFVYCTDGETTKDGIFDHVRMTQKEAEVFEVTLADGRSVKATADHPILTRRGWVQIKDLRSDDEIACIGGVEDGMD